MELSEQQLDEVRGFMESPAGQQIFGELQAAYMAEWIAADHVDRREECWRMVQAVMRLQNLFRDVPAMNLLSRRARERLYEHSTRGV